MAEDLSAAIEKIMKNPEFVGLVKELRGSDESVERTSEELMAKLPEVMEQLSPMFGGSGGDSPKEEKAESDGSADVPAPIITKSPGSFNKSNAERLLRALKPYLSERRCSVIDQCVSVMQLTDLIGASGVLNGLTGRQ